jgi:hypothetical protein
MSLLGTKNRYGDLVRSLGKSALNAIYPEDFEVYLIAFELVDSQDQTLEFFSFPIMPSNITIAEPELVNIKKVNKGIVSLKTTSFIPKDINISGNFGRTFRLIVRDKVVDFTSFKGSLGLLNGEFQGPNIKTGFGSIKVLKRLLEGTKVLDQKGNPTRLYFYNFAFSENYVVEVVDKSFNQSKESNMIWNYNVSLKAVAPITNTVRDRKSLISILTSSSLQKGINTLASNISSALPII